MPVVVISHRSALVADVVSRALLAPACRPAPGDCAPLGSDEQALCDGSADQCASPTPGHQMLLDGDDVASLARTTSRGRSPGRVAGRVLGRGRPRTARRPPHPAGAARSSTLLATGACNSRSAQASASARTPCGRTSRTSSPSSTSTAGWRGCRSLAVTADHLALRVTPPALLVADEDRLFASALEVVLAAEGYDVGRAARRPRHCPSAVTSGWTCCSSAAVLFLLPSREALVRSARGPRPRCGRGPRRAGRRARRRRAGLREQGRRARRTCSRRSRPSCEARRSSRRAMLGGLLHELVQQRRRPAATGWAHAAEPAGAGGARAARAGSRAGGHRQAARHQPADRAHAHPEGDRQAGRALARRGRGGRAAPRPGGGIVMRGTASPGTPRACASTHDGSARSLATDDGRGPRPRRHRPRAVGAVRRRDDGGGDGAAPPASLFDADARAPWSTTSPRCSTSCWRRLASSPGDAPPRRAVPRRAASHGTTRTQRGHADVGRNDRGWGRLAARSARLRGDAPLVALDGLTVAVALTLGHASCTTRARSTAEQWQELAAFLPLAGARRRRRRRRPGPLRQHLAARRHPGGPAARASLAALTLVLLVAVTAVNDGGIPASVVVLAVVLSTGMQGLLRFQSRLFAYRRRRAEGSTGTRVLVLGRRSGRRRAGPRHARAPARRAAARSACSTTTRASWAGRSTASRVLGPALGRRPPRRGARRAAGRPGHHRRSAGGRVACCPSSATAAGLALRLLPTPAELVGGKVTLKDVRDLRIDDLLGRTQVDDRPRRRVATSCAASGCSSPVPAARSARRSPARSRSARPPTLAAAGPRRDPPARHRGDDRRPARAGALRHPAARRWSTGSSRSTGRRSSSTPPRTSTCRCWRTTPARRSRPTSSARRTSSTQR